MAEIRTAALEVLPPGSDSQVAAAKDQMPDMLYVRTVTRNVRLRPVQGATLLFGRNDEEVHLCIGGDDRNVSRVQGSLTFTDGIWWLRNLGRRSLHLPRSLELFAGGDPFPLPMGYTAVLLRTSEERVHALEFYLSDWTGKRLRAEPIAPTVGRQWDLSENERLAIVATAQSHLSFEESPEPWSREAVAKLLGELYPERRWSKQIVGRRVDDVRLRLSAKGVKGLTAEEVGHPVGNRLKHNLIRELMSSGTISPADLERLERVTELGAERRI